MKDLIAIDPGEKAGIALFHEQKLAAVEFVVNAVGGDWYWKGPYQLPVVCEMPQKYVGSNIDMQTLLTLAFSAGYLVSSTQPASLRLVFPREWKGQRPKKVDNAYSMRILNDQERHILESSGIPKSQRHNVLDAVGIGLWALGRR